MKKMALMFIGVAVLVFCDVTHAAISKELTYSENTVWRCAVRFIRVDNGFKILEKDKETGYLLFEYTENGAAYNGSFELLKRVIENREYVRVQVNLHGQPKYMESLLFKKLERKLKNEYGIAPAAKYVGPPKVEPNTEPAADNRAKVPVKEDDAEEDLRITEDDLNENANVK